MGRWLLYVSREDPLRPSVPYKRPLLLVDAGPAEKPSASRTVRLKSFRRHGLSIP